MIALPAVTIFDLVGRYALRKHLHRVRSKGACMRKVVAVGHADVIGELAASLRRDAYHGLDVVAACVLGPDCPETVDGIPVIGGLGNVPAVVDRMGADTVAVLACPEMSGARLRDLAWKLEKTGTDLCVAPALLDVAGPRTTIRPAAGLPLLHLDHPELSGARRLIKSGFDRTAAAVRPGHPAAADGRHRAGHPAVRPRPGPVPAGPGRQGRQPVHRLQVPHHGRRCGAAARQSCRP